jgi:hypothetical protein
MSSSDSSNNPDSTRSLETQPFFLDYEGPPVIGLERPKFPENLDQLKPTERQKAHTLDMALSVGTRNKYHALSGYGIS